MARHANPDKMRRGQIEEAAFNRRKPEDRPRQGWHLMFAAANRRWAAETWTMTTASGQVLTVYGTPPRGPFHYEIEDERGFKQASASPIGRLPDAMLAAETAGDHSDT